MKSTGVKETDVSKDLVALMTAVCSLPEEYQELIKPHVDRVIVSQGRHRKILELIQERLGQLRLDIKYLAFDIVATRQERDVYKRRLEER